MHFNPRLNERALVLNTYHSGRWEDEERATVIFPFKPGEIYTVELVASGRNSVYVYVNGQLLYEFRERQSGNQVSSVEVSGDIDIHAVHVI
ncbi:unnamed protein product [Cylicostephanus goldi]|uniref:Galectin n=1 Tax=Cylicostephanus goldi TaxID=71465 RepID=A0A3P7MQ92_CYLGO|nr:unnamed protein product [Cylicostephanus goldi]